MPDRDAHTNTAARVVYDRAAIFALERPHRDLLLYYAIFSLVAGPLFPLLLIPLFLRYRTLRYRFDDEGIGMRWGAMRRREVDLAYGRIQDIHMVSNAVERWLGLARIKVQTASGSQKAEVTIEGMTEYEALRSFLVDRMRRARGDRGDPGHIRSRDLAGTPIDDQSLDAVRASLEQATAELRALRTLLERRDAAAMPAADVRAGREAEPVEGNRRG